MIVDRVVFLTEVQRRAFLFMNDIRRHPYNAVPVDLYVPDVAEDGSYSRQEMAKFLSDLGYFGLRCLPRMFEYMVVYGLYLENGKVVLIW